MCVAIYKPKGVDAPSEEILEKCWTCNPDGAGFAFRRDDGRVEWCKGFMSFAVFKAAFDHLEDKKGRDVIMHFRIGTSGGNTPGNTHPFPITDRVDELKALCGVADEVLMHNGVLPIFERSKDISDTMELVMRIAELGCGVKAAFKLLRGFIGGDRLFAFTKDGGHVKLGEWHEEGGVWFSNLNWARRRTIVRFGARTGTKTCHDKRQPLLPFGCYFGENDDVQKDAPMMPAKRELKELAKDYYGSSDKASVKSVKRDIRRFSQEYGTFDRDKFVEFMNYGYFVR